MASALGYLASVVTLLAAAIRVGTARGSPPSISRRYFVAALVTTGLALAGTAPATIAAAAGTEPFPNAMRLLANALAMAGAFCVTGVLAHAGRRPSRGSSALRATGLATAVAAMGVLLALADIDHAAEFDARYGRNPAVIGYMGLYVGYIGWACARYARRVHRHTRSQPPGNSLRHGLQITVAAAAVGLCWVAWKALGVAALALGGLIPAHDNVAAALAVAAVVLAGTGLTLPSWSRMLRTVRAIHAVRRAHRRLTPLCSTLAQAVPEVTLHAEPGPPTETGLARLIGAARCEYRLYRRLIEIRDAQLALLPHLPAQTRRWITDQVGHQQLSDTATRTLIDATELALALDAHRACRHDGCATPGGTSTAPGPASTVPGMLAEAAALIHLGTTLRHDPTVRRLRAHAAATTPPTTDT